MLSRMDATVNAALGGDEAAFAEIVGRHRRELRVHCYRMVGSFEESEDLVQETFLRAWQARADFAGRSTLRAWLYRIATNACLDALDGQGRRMLPHQLAAPSAPGSAVVARGDIPWLQPFPDRRGNRPGAATRSPTPSRSPGRRSSWRSSPRSSTCRRGSGRC